MDTLASITIRDVARKAGVSIATVSRALNSPEKVREEVVARIQAAVHVLKYVPHRGARSMVSKRHGAMGALIPTLENPIFAKATQALQGRLNARGYKLVLASTECDPALEYSQLESLIAHGVDGVMLVGATHDRKLQKLLSSKKVPFVNTWVYSASTKAPCIGFDNKRAMTQVVEHLYGLGHRRFAMIAGLTAHNDRALDRVTGVRDALRAVGLDLPRDRLITRPYSFTDGRGAFSQLLELKERPTAVICGNDILALGALLEAYSRGIAIPAAMSITGFDDLDLSSQTTPALTTVRVPAQKIGFQAADCLIALKENQPILAKQNLQASLVVRGSTAAPHPG